MSWPASLLRLQFTLFCNYSFKHISKVLYLYGGLYEEGDKQLTLNDFYSIGMLLYSIGMWLLFFRYVPMIL